MAKYKLAFVALIVQKRSTRSLLLRTDATAKSDILVKSKIRQTPLRNS